MMVEKQNFEYIKIAPDTDLKNIECNIETNHDIYFKNAKKIKNLKDNSIHLVITSPPYWKIKDYGNKDQIGFHDTLREYLDKLNEIWGECIRVLKSGCKMCINIGDQFLRAKDAPKKVYQIIPIHAMIINEILREHEKMVYLGSINWNKVSTSNTSGGGHIMGSIYYPRNGYFFINREYIIVFRKLGKDPRPTKLIKKLSYITLEEWREFFKDTWNFSGINQDVHDAMFPEELPYRLIRMYSFVDDTVLDPFLGSGTTSKVAAQLGRNSIGFEIGFNRENWKDVIKQKVESGKHDFPAHFNYY